MSAHPWLGIVDAEPGVELLERALGYTCAALTTIGPDDLDRPTPCAGWRLGDLLAHMEDALDAFGEGAGGAIGLHSAAPTPAAHRVATLQRKARALHGTWAAAGDRPVLVGSVPMPVRAVSRLAAVEIAVHGWDVSRTTTAGPPLPEPLADALLPVAVCLADTADDGSFAPPRPVPRGAPASQRLLAALGREASYDA